MGEQELIIVGAGGFSREAAQAAIACQHAGAPWRFAGYADDSPQLAGARVDGFPIVGSIDDAARTSAVLAVGIGRPDAYTARMEIVERLGLPAARYATIVHPTANLAATTNVGEGSVVLAGVIATASVQIGRHVALMPGIVLTHDDVIGGFATVASGVKLGGNVRVGTGAYIGAGVLVRENVRIGACAMIGMGSIVTRDVPAGELWFGSPARYQRPAPVPPNVLERVS